MQFFEEKTRFYGQPALIFGMTERRMLFVLEKSFIFTQERNQPDLIIIPKAKFHKLSFMHL